MASDGRLRRLGWGSGIGTVAVMCASYGAVEPTNERCTFPDSAYNRADRNIRGVAIAGVSLATLIAAARFVLRGRPDAEPGTVAEGSGRSAFQD